MAQIKISSESVMIACNKYGDYYEEWQESNGKKHQNIFNDPTNYGTRQTIASIWNLAIYTINTSYPYVLINDLEFGILKYFLKDTQDIK